MDYGIPEEILQEWYENKLEEITATHTVELRIHYKLGSGTYDNIKKVWSVTEDKTVDVYCSYREDTKVGTIINSNVIQGMPTGDYKIFIPYENRFIVENVTNYINNSLYFTLRPDSDTPIVLYPKSDSVETIEFFFERSDMPLTQRFVCSIRKI